MGKDLKNSIVKEPDVTYGNILLISTLMEGKYQASRLMTFGDKAKSSVLSGFELDLGEFFADIT